MTAKSEPENLKARVERFFSAAAEDIATGIKRRGRLLTVPVEQSSVVRDGDNPNNYRLEVRKVARNILDRQLPPQLGRDDVLLSDELAAEALEIAITIATLPNAHLPFFAPFGPTDGLIKTRMRPGPSFEDEPADWTLGRLFLPALYTHLEKLPSVDEATAHRAHVFAEEVLAFATAPGMTYRSTIPIAGLTLDTDWAVMKLSDDVRLRRLTSDEQGDIAEAAMRDPFVMHSLPLCALEVDCTTGRLDQNPDTRLLVETWLSALELQGHQITARYAETTNFPAWTGFATGRAPLNMNRLVREWSAVAETDVPDLVHIVRESRKYDLKQKKTATHALALHRYHLGMAKESAVESLLDFVISLEAILLPRDGQVGHSDLSYRFRVHGAHYLGSGADERHDIYKRMGELYTLRSILVHGGKYPEASTISKARDDAESFARDALNRALREGFPGAQTFLDMVLGNRGPAVQ